MEKYQGKQRKETCFGSALSQVIPRVFWDRFPKTQFWTQDGGKIDGTKDG